MIDNKVKNGEAKLDLPQLHDHRRRIDAGRRGRARGGRPGPRLELRRALLPQPGRGALGLRRPTNSSNAIAKGAGVKDIAQWNTEREGAKFNGRSKKTTEQAQSFGFNGTPSFAIKGPSTNGIELLGTPSSPGEIEEAIEKAS